MHVVTYRGVQCTLATLSDLWCYTHVKLRKHADNMETVMTKQHAHLPSVHHHFHHLLTQQVSHNERGLYWKITFNPNETLGHSEDQQLPFDLLSAVLLALANIIHLLNKLRHDNNEDNKI